MPHFLITKEEIKDNIVELNDSDNIFHIVNVRRAKIGEQIKFIDKDYIVYYCKITKIDKKTLTADILSKQKSPRILKYDISLIQSVLAPDAQNLLIANATQTGVKNIYPVISDNVSLKVKNDKIQKWQKIAYENFKQCERADIPNIFPILPLKEALRKFKKENILIFSEKDINITLDNALKNTDKTSQITVVIGPEGGFSNSEFEYFKNEEFKLISLGSMIYKAPNAVVAGISNIISRLDNE